MSTSFALYAVATGTSFEMEIGVVAAFIILHLSGFRGSHHCIPRGTPISIPRLRLNFSRGSMITTKRNCDSGSLTRASTCTLVSPGSDDTPLLMRRTQSNVPLSSHTALSKLIGPSAAVWVGVEGS